MTDEYLKMVLALPDEFFENITPEFGNLFWVETYQGWEDGYSRKTYAILDHVFESGNYSLILMDSTQIDERLYKWDFQYNKRDEVTYWRGWLIPSQEQLQKMSGISAFTFIHMLHSFSEDQLQYGNKIPYDINCITLAFLVNLKYNYIWDGEKWI